MNLSIRHAAVEDANLIMVLSVVTFYEAYFEDEDPRDITNYISRTYGAEQIKDELLDESSTFLIAEIDGKAVGLAKLRENSRPECLQDESTIELHRLYLMERVWRRGIGKMLVEKCLFEAKQKGYRSMWLGTWAENLRAQMFYQKLGFEKVGEFQYDYESKVAVNFVLRKEL